MTNIPDPKPITALADEGPTTPPRGHWRDVWDQFKTHKGAVLGLFFLTFITLFCIAGPWIWSIDPGALDVRNKDVRPIYTAIWDGNAKVSWARPMGTDNLGRDLMANLMQGGRISLAVGWTAMILAILIGTLIGVLAGYFRAIDGLLMRFTDLVLALPLLPLLLVMMLLFRDPLRASFGPEQGFSSLSSPGSESQAGCRPPGSCGAMSWPSRSVNSCWPPGRSARPRAG